MKNVKLGKPKRRWGHAGDAPGEYGHIRFNLKRDLSLPVIPDDELLDLIGMALVFGKPLPPIEQRVALVRLAELLNAKKRGRGNPGGRSADAARRVEVLADLGIMCGDAAVKAVAAEKNLETKSVKQAVRRQRNGRHK